MRINRFKLWLVAFALIPTLLLADGPSPRVVQGVTGGLVSLDPFTIAGIEAYEITGNVIEPLARIDAFSKKLKPWLAESWKVVDERLRVDLRAGVKFHSGETLSADDVKFTLEAYRDPKFGGAFWASMWADVERVEVTAPLRVEFHFKKKRLTYSAYVNLLTALRILPRAVYTHSKRADRDRRIVGTGPFQQTRFEPGRALELAPYPGWWGRAPRFSLLIKTVADAKAAEQLAGKDQLDFFVPPPGAISAKYQGFDSPTGDGIWIDLNLKSAMFKDVRVREALALVWDREALNRKIYGGRWQIAADTFSPLMPFYPPARVEKMNLARARELLQAAGYADHDKDGVLESSLGKLSFTLVVRNAESERWATLFQADAAKNGIQVRLKRVEEESQWWALLKEARFDAVAGGGPVNDEVYYDAWHSRGAYNFYGYHDLKTDQLLEALSGLIDPSARAGFQKKLIALVRAQRTQVAGLFSARRYFQVSSRIQVDPRAPQAAWLWRLKD